MKRIPLLLCFLFMLPACNQTPEVRRLKSSTLTLCPEKTIEEIFSPYLRYIKWEGGVVEDGCIKGKIIVNISGDHTFDGDSAPATIQLVETGDGFELYAMEVDGKPKPDFMILMFMALLCE